jgi:myosin-3
LILIVFFIHRCIRPNKDKIPGYFDSEIVSTQLKYTGVLETTKIRRLGYSNRIAFADFLRRYSILVYPFLNKELSPTKESCLDILYKLKLENWKIGKTKVFLKYYHAEKLSKMYDDFLKKIVIIQSAIRRYLARKLYAQKKASVNKSATVIQRCFRKHLARKRNKKLHDFKTQSLIRLQAYARGYLARKKAEKRKIEKLEKQKKLMYEKFLKAVKTIQSFWRGYEVRKVYKQLKLDKAIKDMKFSYFCQQVISLVFLK